MKLRVRPCQILRGSVTVPGDKSISHRALLLGAIVQGVSTVRKWLPADDCQATLNALCNLGVTVEQVSPTELLVHGAGLRGLSPPAASIDCRGSGTTIRLLAGILAARLMAEPRPRRPGGRHRLPPRQPLPGSLLRRRRSAAHRLYPLRRLYGWLPRRRQEYAA